MGEEILEAFGEDGKLIVNVALIYSEGLSHYYLGTEHLFMAMTKLEGSLTQKLLAHFELDPRRVRNRLKLEAGPGFRDPPWEGIVPTPRLGDTFQVACELAEEEGHPQVGERHLLLAILVDEDSLPARLLGQMGVDVPQVLAQAKETPWSPVAEGEPPPYDMDASFPGRRPDPAQGPENKDFPARFERKGLDGDSPRPPRKGGKTPFLDQYGRDLTALAQADQLHPAIGESAHRAMVQIGLILQQTQANNPILLGDAGVGKTAIVEGFAWRLAVGADHDQPVIAKLAGKRILELTPTALLAGTRYRGDLEERLQKLVDEVHATSGQTVVFIDEIHTILGGRADGGLSAISDALKPALARGEFPCIGATTVKEYRRHIEADPALARRFTPVWIEEPGLNEAIEIVRGVAEQHLAPEHRVVYTPEAVEEAVRLSARHLHDEHLPGKAIKLLDQAGPRVTMGGSLRGLEEEDKDLTWSGGRVTAEIVREIVSERTGIPLASLSQDEAQKLLHLEEKLKARVKGQDEAVTQVARVVKRARAGLGDPRRPLGVFLFAGPTGVGKTELARTLAWALFDDEDALFQIDMSEYMEKHQVSRLIGAPPGYVGYEEEGQLTGRLRRRPYSVVLLDEMEKAHDDVQHLFLQLFDTGRLTDSHGNRADGRNAIFIMTTNLGAKEALGFASVVSSYRDKLRAAIHDRFTLEFINRIDRTVYFNPLDEAALMEIFDREFAPFQARLRERGVEATVPEGVKRDIVGRVAEQKLGARPLRRIIEDKIVSPIVDQLLAGQIKAGPYQVNEVLDFDSLAEPLPLKQAPDSDGPAADQARIPLGRISPALGVRSPLTPGLFSIQESFQRCLSRLTERLQEKDIRLEITEEARLFISDPANLARRGNRPLEQAFSDLIEKPLDAKVEAGEFGAGDRVRVILKDGDTIEFEQVGEETDE
jgi:ATP-dependent Clp protease ATP-binding subunit ClpC